MTKHASISCQEQQKLRRQQSAPREESSKKALGGREKYLQRMADLKQRWQDETKKVAMPRESTEEQHQPVLSYDDRISNKLFGTSSQASPLCHDAVRSELQQLAAGGSDGLTEGNQGLGLTDRLRPLREEFLNTLFVRDHGDVSKAPYSSLRPCCQQHPGFCRGDSTPAMDTVHTRFCVILQKWTQGTVFKMRFEAEDSTSGEAFKVLGLNDTIGRMVLLPLKSDENGLSWDRHERQGFGFEMTQTALLNIWRSCSMLPPKRLILERFSRDFDFEPVDIHEATNFLPPRRVRVPAVRRRDVLLPYSGDGADENNETAELSAKGKLINAMLKELFPTSVKASIHVDDDENEDAGCRGGGDLATACQLRRRRRRRQRPR